MAFYWKIKEFESQEAMDEWVSKNSNRYWIREIFINNGYGVEYKDLRKF